MAQRLLLADDSVTIQRVIELTFADENINVVAVSDGDEAIARIDADPPDIVLADIGMPGRDGYEVSAHVKSTPRLAHIPVVLLTGAFEPVDQQRATQVRSDGVLAKPFEPQLVIARVKELLGSAHSQAPTQSAPAARREESPAPPNPPAPAASFAAPPVAPAASPVDEPPLDEYFDRLDAAFANLSAQTTPSTQPRSQPAATEVPDIDWFGASPSPAPDMPLSYASPQPVAGSPEPPAQATFASAAAVPLPVIPAPAVPTLGDAFATILAAEQAEGSAGAVRWPAPPPDISDDVVEEVARRVLDRMSDQVVRETVSSIVSSVAERLIREEIERIKASIK